MHFLRPSVFPPPAAPTTDAESQQRLFVARSPALRITLADALALALADLGVVSAYGLVGGAIAPLAESLLRSPIEVLHFRHETGAAFAAAEAYFATGAPRAVFTTTGPGITNAMTGLMAARCEGAKVVLVSGATSPRERGRGAFQETSAYTFAHSALCEAGPVFDFAASLDGADDLATVTRRLAAGLARPQGFVAHVALPVRAQMVECPRPQRAGALVGPPAPAPSAATVARVAEMLASGPFVVWVGFGARRAADLVRALAERTGARVMCSPRAKGVMPEDHPLYLGTTGLGASARVARAFARGAPAHVLVVGTRLGEFTSFWDRAFVPRECFVHVDVDPTVPGAAYPADNVFAVHAEAREFLEALLAALPARASHVAASSSGAADAAEDASHGDDDDHAGSEPSAPREGDRVRPQALMAALQRVVVEGSDAVVLSEAGNAFAWTNHYLHFRGPLRYRVSVGFGSMGHAVAGVVGAALGRRGKAVAVVGDGAMLMNSEVSTAVQYGADAVWVVLNDAQYGMIEQGMRGLGLAPVETQFPAVDFVAIARAVGADGVRVTREADLDAALAQAMKARGPFVVDVAIDPREAAPVGNRIKSLVAQGVESDAGPRRGGTNGGGA